MPDRPDGTLGAFVSTEDADNIVIDKLTEGAYTERRRTISNNGETPSWGYADGATRVGKFFPRGCRGFIESVDVYCKETSGNARTITVYLSPQPSMGYLYSANISLAANDAADWRSATFNKMWNYDSLFIFVLCSHSSAQFGYDSETPYDRYLSNDAGVTWSTQNNRDWFRAIYKGQTVGDLPVSGTLNLVEIPAVSSVTFFVGTSIAAGANSDILDVEGAGHLEPWQGRFYGPTTTVSYEWRVYIDDNTTPAFTAFLSGLGALTGFAGPTDLDHEGAVVSFTEFDGTNGRFAFSFFPKLHFKRKLRINLRNNHASTTINATAFFNVVRIR